MIIMKEDKFKNETVLVTTNFSTYKLTHTPAENLPGYIS